MIKSTIGALFLLLGFYTPSAQAHHISVFDECKRYRVSEEYTKGYVDEYGDYRRGHITTRRNRVGCYPLYPVAHATPHPQYPHHHSVNTYPPAPSAPSLSASGAPVIVNQNQATAPINSCGKVGRMTAGAIGGGITGYVIGGGKKSSKTLLNTAIGSGLGAVLGRLTC